MKFDELEAALRHGHKTKDAARQIVLDLRRKLKALADDKWSPAHVQEATQRLRAAAEVEASKVATNALAELARARADEPQHTRQALMRSREYRYTPAAPVDHVLTGDAATRALLADVREQLTAQRWLLQLPRMTAQEMLDTFSQELPRNQFAVCSAIWREAEHRAATAPDDDSDARRLPVELNRVLQATDLPVFTKCETLFADLRLVEGYITDAVEAITTGDDAGLRRERIVELRRAGATNDQINQAMQQMRQEARAS